MITLQNPDLAFLLTDLEEFNYLQLSLQPDIPGEDELINHKLINKQVIETKTGLILILDLENVDTGEKYSYSYSDIVRVETNSHSSHYMGKYYIYCLNREKEYKISELIKKQKLGLQLNEQEKKLILQGNTNIFRIICRNNKM